MSQKKDLTWMRAKRDETITSHRRTWRAREAPYAVQECTSKFEKKDNGKPLVAYYAVHENRILSRHRIRRKAEESCEKHFRSSR